MIIKEASRAASKVRTGIQFFGSALVAFMMIVPVGLPLVLGGVFSGLIPLAIGIAAAFRANSLRRELIR